MLKKNEKLPPAGASFVCSVFLFFFNDTATTEIYTLSLHDALPIWGKSHCTFHVFPSCSGTTQLRSEEHTSELQSPCNLVCRLLLEKKKRHQQHIREDAAQQPAHGTPDAHARA